MFHWVLNTPLTCVFSEHIFFSLLDILLEVQGSFLSFVKFVKWSNDHLKMHKVCTVLYVEIHFLANCAIIKMISDCRSSYRFLILGMIMWLFYLKSL